MEHDERIVDAVRARVEDRRLGDVHLGNLLPPEGGAVLDVHVPEARELGRSDADRVRLEEQPDAALAAEKRQHLPDDFIHARKGSKRLQRGPVGGMLPGDGGDVWQRTAGPRGGEIRHVMGLVMGFRHYA